MTYIMTVSSIRERDDVVRRIRRSYEVKLIDNPELELIQESVNKIRLYHCSKHTRTLIRTILIIVLPILINWRPVEEIYDNQITYDLTSVYEELARIKKKIEQLKKTTGRKPSANAEELDRVLSDIYD